MRVLIVSVLLLLLQTAVFACTTFASLGANNIAGGLLIGKQRDSLAQYQQLEVRAQKNSIPYLGLFYNQKPDGQYPYIAAGVNQKGLVVVQNESASVNNASHFSDQDQSQVIYTLLKHYHSVKQVLAHQKTLFGNGLANFLIVGDRHDAILVEVGPKKNSYQILHAKDHDNVLYHTNHYVLPGMKIYNAWFFLDSKLRFQQISKLLHSDKKPFRMMVNGYSWLTHAVNGPIDSIFRQYTVASWLVYEPQNGFPKVWVRFVSRKQTYATYKFVLNKAFWKSPAAYIKPEVLSAAALQPVKTSGSYQYDEQE